MPRDRIAGEASIDSAGGAIRSCSGHRACNQSVQSFERRSKVATLKPSERLPARMQAKGPGGGHVDRNALPHAGSVEGNAVPPQCTEPRARIASGRETVIPVVREELDVRKRRVETDSGVRVHKMVKERQAIVDEPLAKDEVRVERVKIDRTVDAPVEVRYEGDTMIIPVLEEVLVVQKRLVLKEEIHVARRRSQTRAPQRVTLRSETAEIERIEGGDGGVPEAGQRNASSSHATPPPASSLVTASATTTAAPDEDLIERKRKQTELRRGRLAKTRLLY